MEPAAIIEISRLAIETLLKLSLPILGVSLVVGLLISLLQALTQIQEPTLSFVPKILAIFATILLLLPYIGNTMGSFTTSVFDFFISPGM